MHWPPRVRGPGNELLERMLRIAREKGLIPRPPREPEPDLEDPPGPYPQPEHAPLGDRCGGKGVVRCSCNAHPLCEAWVLKDGILRNGYECRGCRDCRAAA